MARGKAQGKPRHESQSPLSPQAEKYVRTERPVVCSEGAHRRVVFAHSSSYSEWNVDKTWSCQDWKSDELMDDRTVRPTLCKNDLDPNDNSDSDSASSSSITN